MPIYEYECAHCGVFEVSQRITEAPLRRCPKCRRKVQKLISQTSFTLKGDGWYVTDYARKGNGASRKEAGKGKEGATDSAGSASKDTAKSTASA